VTASPQPSAMPPTTTPPPCSAEPERWFDQAHRTHALAACLQCPARRWCAQEALQVGASWGMWAGIWIEGRRTEVAHYLRAIATDGTIGINGGAVAIEAPAPPATAESNRSPLPHTRPLQAGGSGSVSAVVLGRSSGHCEVVSERCRLTADTHVSRVLGWSPREASSAAEVIVACTPCAESMAALNRHEARRLGYVIDSSPQAPNVPLYWRGARWVLLGRLGQLHDAGWAVDAARAS
jgi:hypothetical protein